VALNWPAVSYTPERYHGIFLATAIGALLWAINSFLAARLSHLQLLALLVHMLGLKVLVEPLWAPAPGRRSARAALLDFRSGGGWSSAGASTVPGTRTRSSSM
jgi:hypothetical protein